MVWGWSLKKLGRYVSVSVISGNCQFGLIVDEFVMWPTVPCEAFWMTHVWNCRFPGAMGKNCRVPWAVLPSSPPFSTIFPREVAKYGCIKKGVIVKTPMEAAFPCRDKHYSLQKSGSLTRKPNNWRWMNGQESRGFPQMESHGIPSHCFLHAGDIRMWTGANYRLGCQVTRVPTDFHLYFISGSGKPS